MFIFGSEYARELLQNSQNISSLILVVASRRTKMSKILIYFCILVVILAFECNAGHAPHAPHYADYPSSRMRRIHLKYLTVSCFNYIMFMYPYVVLCIFSKRWCLKLPKHSNWQKWKRKKMAWIPWKKLTKFVREVLYFGEMFAYQFRLDSKIPDSPFLSWFTC